MLGLVEVAIALLIAARPFSPRASALGSALAVGMFLTTLSFLVTTPGAWEPSLGGFPALSALPGQFLIKDLALLGISLWSFGEAWKASERARGASPLSVRARPEAVVVALNRKRSAVMSKKLEGQVVVVTGASKGIGAAIAEYLAAAGAAVVINYASSKTGADAVVNRIRQADGKAVAVQADVSEAEDIHSGC